MYLRVEKLWRLDDDSWGTEARLVNFDHAGVLSLSKAGSATAQDPVTIDVTFGTAVGTESYYFGPPDMTDQERDSRLSALLEALQGGSFVSWTRARDLRSRDKGHGLSNTAKP